LTGYFSQDFSNKKVSWNHIIYDHIFTNKLNDSKKIEYSVIPITKPLYKKIELSEYPKLKKALVETDRLIN